jgi:isocitrate dehydrogenase
VDIQGYFRPSGELASQAMRPSKTLNDALAMVAKG